MGDGVLVYFGDPDATDEAPRQAIHAALSIIQQTKERRSGIKDTYRVEIDVRIGIHTGLAVITEMGGGNRREVADIVGETPNIAARLEALADPGTVLISGDTYGLVTGYFKTLARGPQQLKNISHAIMTFQVIDATGATSRAEASGVAGRMPLVGRSVEHRKLEAIRDEVAAGKGRTLVISGEAGIGKSRLVELAMTQMTAGWPVLNAGCAPHTQSTPLHPLRRILTSGRRTEPRARKRHRARKVAPYCGVDRLRTEGAGQAWFGFRNRRQEPSRLAESSFVKGHVFDPADFHIRSDGVCRLNPETARMVVAILKA